MCFFSPCKIALAIRGSYFKYRGEMLRFCMLFGGQMLVNLYTYTYFFLVVCWDMFSGT